MTARSPIEFTNAQGERVGNQVQLSAGGASIGTVTVSSGNITLTAGDNDIGNVDLVPQSGNPTHVHEPVANTAAVVTLAAPGAGVRNVVGGVYWSYDDDPTGGNLTITASGNTVISVDITTGGPGFLPFTPPMQGNLNGVVQATLAAGGAGISGIVNLHAWTE